MDPLEFRFINAYRDGDMKAHRQLTEGAALIECMQEAAKRRDQSLAQMAIAWVLRDPRITSALLGASSVAQLEQNVAALDHLEFEPDELEQIDKLAVEGGVNIWATSSSE